MATLADRLSERLETRVEISSGDEIGMLGENFNYMADRLLILMRETAEKATLEKELEVARTIQETLVPPADLVDLDSRGPFAMSMRRSLLLIPSAARAADSGDGNYLV